MGGRSYHSRFQWAERQDHLRTRWELFKDLCTGSVRSVVEGAVMGIFISIRVILNGFGKIDI